MAQWSATQVLIYGMMLVFCATTAGAFPVLLIRDLGDKTKSLFLGLSAGVMLGATFFSLLIPALDLYEARGLAPISSASMVGVGMLIGAFLLYVFHQMIPHEHFYKSEVHHKSDQWSQQMLVILAVALHNLPEGIAVGVGFGSGQAHLGFSISTAIALQDFPEGLIVALGLRTLGMPFGKIFWITAATGFVEAIGVPIGFFGAQITDFILPLSFAMCAGAMLFVISHEIIPESHGESRELHATVGVMLGFVLMMILDKGLTVA